MDIPIRKGCAVELESFLAFTHEVRDAMADTAWVALDPDEELRELTDDGSMEFWLADGWQPCSASSVPVCGILIWGARSAWERRNYCG